MQLIDFSFSDSIFKSMKTLAETSLSILDLVNYPQGKTIPEAFQRAKEFAQKAEALGFERFWMAEHHNLNGIASSATAVLIGFIASHTKTIRVGSGGIMLPNHSPLIVAEQFGTLASLYPGRIDLGLGRAPGTDPWTARALGRDHKKEKDFGELIQELEYFFAPPQEGQKIKAIPGAGIEIPFWILGSSLYSAQLAARTGRPYAFAGHFAPAQMIEAVDLYRHQFIPSEHLSKPRVMIGVGVVASETDEKAEFLATSAQQRFLSLIRGDLMQTPPPVKSMDHLWTVKEKEHVQSMIRNMIVGGPEKVRKDVQSLIDRTQADELIVTSDLFDDEDRHRSIEILMAAKKNN